MTYYTILIQGTDTIKAYLDKTFKNQKENRVNGIVIGDLPIKEAELPLNACEKHDICLIFLIAPSTIDIRLEKILKGDREFIYLFIYLFI